MSSNESSNVRNLSPEERRLARIERRIRENADNDAESGVRPPAGKQLQLRREGASAEGVRLPRITDESRLRPAQPTLPAFQITLPQAEPTGSPPKRPRRWFLGCLLVVIIPMVAFFLYLSFVSSEQYVAEFRFAVTEVSPTTPNAAPTSGASAGIGSLLTGLGLPSNTSSQTFVVSDYLISRQAIKDLARRVDIEKAFGRATIDFYHQLPLHADLETLYRYWQKHVLVTYDQTSGLASVQVLAFTALDALNISNALVQQSEELVNKIASRSKTEMVDFSEKEVGRAQSKLDAVRKDLFEFREKSGVIEPNSGAVNTNIQLVLAVRSSITQLETDLAAARNQSLNAASPIVTSIQSKLTAARQQLNGLQAEISLNNNAKGALATTMARYEELDLQRQYAQNALLYAQQNYDQARSAAATQSFYLTPYVRPSLPEAPLFPNRPLDLALAAIVLVSLWLIGSAVLANMQEH